METEKVIAQEERGALHKGAKVQLRRGARVQPAQVLSGNGWPFAFAVKEHRLHARKNFARTIARNRRPSAMGKRFGQHQKLDPPVEGKLRHLVYTETLCKFGRRWE